MRIIMMGTGPFAVPTLLSLMDSSHEVVVLVTRPLPAVRTRGKLPKNPTREAGAEAGLEILSPQDVNDAAVGTQLATLRPDLLVVCDYGQILSADALSVARLGGINLHGSLLPKYRGAAPVQWAILNGETETGTSVIHMTPRLDAGPCLVQNRTAIGPSETAEELEERLATLGVDSVRTAIEMLEKWNGAASIGTPQDPDLATRAPRLKKSDGQVDWTRPAIALHNQVRGLKPWPGSFTHWRRGDGKELRLILDRVAAAPNESGGESPGTVTSCSADHLIVATGEGSLAIESIQPAGKRPMRVGEFLRGHDVVSGSRFS
jgi:methionyl-tRNA formyltransferase